MARRIVLVAGEISGDILGAGLLAQLRSRYPDCAFAGIGGTRMQAEGLQSWFAMEQLSIMGLVEVLRHLPDLFALKRALVERILAWQPDLFIGIDAPDFNLRLARELHANGIRTVHYVSPSVWAWRQSRVEGIRRDVDLMLTLFPFEATFYRESRVPVHWVGHPMADQIPLENPVTPARQALAVPVSGRLITLLPGSRSAEVGLVFPVMLQAAARLLEREAGVHFLVAAANAARKQQIEALLAPVDAKLAARIHVHPGEARLCMAAADAVIVTSGTATLECMLVGRPMVVLYRMAWLSYWIMRCLIRIPRVALPNLLAEEALVPELIQADCTPDNILRELEAVCEPQRRSYLLERFRTLHESLRCEADVRAAEAVIKLLDSPR